MEKIRKMKTAVVGCGMISNIYIKNLKHLFSIIDLVAVCDLNRQAAEEKASTYGIERVMTIDEVEQSEEIELVVNLTGPAAHYDVIKRMLMSGKHVYTEKILTTDLERGKELVELAERKKLYLGVAPDTVLGAGIQTAKKVIDSGFIGDVTSCMMSISRNQSLNSEKFRFLRGDGGALPYDVGIYYIGALIAMFGTVKEVRAFGLPAPVHEAQMLFQGEEESSWQIPGNNLLCGLLLMENDVLCSLHMDGNSVKEEKTTFRIYGTDGVLELGDPNTFDGYVKLYKPETGECTVPHTHGYNGKNYLPDSMPFDGYGHRGVGVAEMAYAIRRNRKNRCSKEYGYHCMEVLFGLDEAAQTGMTYKMKSHCEMEPMRSGYYSTQFGGKSRGDAERSLY